MNGCHFVSGCHFMSGGHFVHHCPAFNVYKLHTALQEREKFRRQSSIEEIAPKSSWMFSILLKLGLGMYRGVGSYKNSTAKVRHLTV